MATLPGMKERCADKGLVYFFAFYGSKIVNIAVMQGPGHAVFHTFGGAVAQVALGGDAPFFLEMDTPEGTGIDTHLASHTG